MMETKLERIPQLSSEQPELVYTSVGHLINKEMLKRCHEQMDGKKAAGIDGITKEDYEKNLEENLARLVESLKRKAYKPKPARKVEIPKELSLIHISKEAGSDRAGCSYCRHFSRNIL